LATEADCWSPPFCSCGIDPGARDGEELADLGRLEKSVFDHSGYRRVVGVDRDGEARVLELPGRRFFIATLFVPQLSSSPNSPHPLITAYLRAATQAADPSVGHGVRSDGG
jgi:hypothetical protein